MNDNYLGELDQIKYLQGYTNLRELVFQGAQNGTNPMCDFENYDEAVRLFLPQVTKLDGRELIPGLKTVSPHRKPLPPQTAQVSMFNENLNITNQHNPFKPAAQVRRKSPLTMRPEQQQAPMTRDQVAEKDKLIDKLYGDVKELHIKVERLTNERNEVMEKYQESEKIWRGK